MRGHKNRQQALFYTINLEAMVRQDHPLRVIKKLALSELGRLNDRFNAAYSVLGKPSIPPETLIMATLLQALYSIRSERQLCEDIKLNLLYRWFLDMKPDDEVFDHSSFTKNRERFHEHGLMQAFFDGTVANAIRNEAVSCEHFSVDGTLIQSMASLKSFKPKDEPIRPRAARARRASRATITAGQTSRARNAPTTRTKAKRIRGAALSQGQGPRSQALPQRPRADGESQRAIGGADGGTRQRSCRA